MPADPTVGVCPIDECERQRMCQRPVACQAPGINEPDEDDGEWADPAAPAGLPVGDDPALSVARETVVFDTVWVHCSPALVYGTNGCPWLPRRVCACESNGSHDHAVPATVADSLGLKEVDRWASTGSSPADRVVTELHRRLNAEWASLTERIAREEGAPDGEGGVVLTGREADRLRSEAQGLNRAADMVLDVAHDLGLAAGRASGTPAEPPAPAEPPTAAQVLAAYTRWRPDDGPCPVEEWSTGLQRWVPWHGARNLTRVGADPSTPQPGLRLVPSETPGGAEPEQALADLQRAGDADWLDDQRGGWES